MDSADKHSSLFVRTIIKEAKNSFLTSLKGLNMLPHTIRDPALVNATFDMIFHYVDGRYKIRLHHYLMNSIVDNKMFQNWTELEEVD
jgi:hypothetical protein